MIFDKPGPDPYCKTPDKNCSYSDSFCPFSHISRGDQLLQVENHIFREWHASWKPVCRQGVFL